MGDRVAPTMFNAAIWEDLSDWTYNYEQQLDADQGSALETRCTMIERPVDLSLTVFADDIRKKEVCPLRAGCANGAGERLVGSIVQGARWLQAALEQGGYAVNATKTRVVPKIVGKGARAELAYLYTQRVFPGEVVRATRYLGPIVHMDNSNGIERGRRVQAAQAAYSLLRGYWRSRAPRSAKRLVYIAVVQDTLLTGQEAMLYTDHDCKAYDTVVLRHLRAIMQGKACEKSEGVEGEEGGGVKRYKAMSNKELWRIMRLCPAVVELRKWRIRWMQAVARHPERHIQLIAALFGRARCDAGEAVDEHGALTAHAPRLAQALSDAVAEIADFDDGASVWQDAGGSLYQLISMAELAERFAQVDPAALRRRWWSCRVPPPGWASALVGDFGE